MVDKIGTERRNGPLLMPLLIMIFAGLGGGNILVAQTSQTAQQVETTSNTAGYLEPWRYGVDFGGGFPVSYDVHIGDARFGESLRILSGALEMGRTLTAVHGPSLLRGQAEAAFELIPFWLATVPQQTVVIRSPENATPTEAVISSYTSHGASVTPLLFRWNFIKHPDVRTVPWVQLGSGLLWTANEFPQRTGGTGSNTSRINFTPQVDLGEHLFLKQRNSLDVEVKFVHISSAGLGESNPGIPFSIQFGVGYSWWKYQCRQR